jgi:hypothetical protein
LGEICATSVDDFLNETSLLRLTAAPLDFISDDWENGVGDFCYFWGGARWLAEENFPLEKLAL